MAFSGEFSFRIMDDFDKIIDEKGNNFIALRKICWGNSDEAKLDLRKYTTKADGTEQMLKGVSFLTEEGPHELTKVLLAEGYGRTDDVLETISKRDDFRHCLNKVLSPDDELYDESVVGEEFFVPSTDNLFDYDEE